MSVTGASVDSSLAASGSGSWAGASSVGVSATASGSGASAGAASAGVSLATSSMIVGRVMFSSLMRAAMSLSPSSTSSTSSRSSSTGSSTGVDSVAWSIMRRPPPEVTGCGGCLAKHWAPRGLLAGSDEMLTPQPKGWGWAMLVMRTSNPSAASPWETPVSWVTALRMSSMTAGLQKHLALLMLFTERQQRPASFTGRTVCPGIGRSSDAPSRGSQLVPKGSRSRRHWRGTCRSRPSTCGVRRCAETGGADDARRAMHTKPRRAAALGGTAEERRREEVPIVTGGENVKSLSPRIRFPSPRSGRSNVLL
mmetsp:Transcript_32943/g.104891  ORF Transcript_32943/g.104891 Transcript_32943/m.104891 type:complete len:309 (+) Transcript_32943:834-1760(+)